MEKNEADTEDNIITASGVVKKYGNKAAVNRVDLNIRRGEIFGFLGPNGAGKTTTVRILSTLTNFDEGQIFVDGFDITKNPSEAKTRMGIIQQHISLDKDLTVWENMYHRALMQQIPKNRINLRLKELSDYFSLGEYMDRKIDSLSGGWKKRVAIVCAMVHSPKVIFLDEPTVGLDIKARRLLWDLIRLLNRDGTTVFLTTHYIEEAQMLCDRVGIIDEGKIIALGTPKELAGRVGEYTVAVTDSEGKTEYRYFRDRNSAAEYGAGTANGEVLIRKTNLEDCFVELTGKKVKE
jgi:ABC-2 type transport system ATP-binding protein